MLITADCMIRIVNFNKAEVTSHETKIWLLPATIAALVLVATPRAPADEFYKDKTLTFVVGFSAGGGFDPSTRLIARHIGKHIPGNPTVVVEDKPEPEA